jgi:hypothetical protein
MLKTQQSTYTAEMLAQTLSVFEQKHGMSTGVFLEKWRRGELTCGKHDYARWAVLARAAAAAERAERKR